MPQRRSRRWLLCGSPSLDSHKSADLKSKKQKGLHQSQLSLHRSSVLEFHFTLHSRRCGLHVYALLLHRSPLVRLPASGLRTCRHNQHCTRRGRLLGRQPAVCPSLGDWGGTFRQWDWPGYDWVLRGLQQGHRNERLGLLQCLRNDLQRIGSEVYGVFPVDLLARRRE